MPIGSQIPQGQGIPQMAGPGINAGGGPPAAPEVPGRPVQPRETDKLLGGALHQAAMAKIQEHAGKASADDQGDEFDITGPSDYDTIFDEAGKKYGIDPQIIKAVQMRESGGEKSPNTAKGDGGKAVGPMQLHEEAAAEMGVTDRMDPRQNIMGGAAYLAKQMKKYDNDLPKALAAYNMGPGATDKWIKGGAKPADMNSGTRSYLQGVQTNLEKISAKQLAELKNPQIPGVPGRGTMMGGPAQDPMAQQMPPVAPKDGSVDPVALRQKMAGVTGALQGGRPGFGANNPNPTIQNANPGEFSARDLSANRFAAGGPTASLPTTATAPPARPGMPMPTFSMDAFNRNTNGPSNMQGNDAVRNGVPQRGESVGADSDSLESRAREGLDATQRTLKKNPIDAAGRVIKKNFPEAGAAAAKYGSDWYEAAKRTGNKAWKDATGEMGALASKVGPAVDKLTGTTPVTPSTAQSAPGAANPGTQNSRQTGPTDNDELNADDSQQGALSGAGEQGLKTNGAGGVSFEDKILALLERQGALSPEAQAKQDKSDRNDTMLNLGLNMMAAQPGRSALQAIGDAGLANQKHRAARDSARTRASGKSYDSALKAATVLTSLTSSKAKHALARSKYFQDASQFKKKVMADAYAADIKAQGKDGLGEIDYQGAQRRAEDIAEGKSPSTPMPMKDGQINYKGMVPGNNYKMNGITAKYAGEGKFDPPPQAQTGALVPQPT